VCDLGVFFDPAANCAVGARGPLYRRWYGGLARIGEIADARLSLGCGLPSTGVVGWFCAV
jgi:hypothetical protein